MRKQAKFYLSEDAIARLRQESARTTYSMSTIVTMLATKYLPKAVDEPVDEIDDVAGRDEASDPVEPNTSQKQGDADDYDFQF